MTADSTLGPNDTEACPSRGCLVRSRAHGRICPVCEPDAERPVRCPLCLDTVTAVGPTIQPHKIGGRGYGFTAIPCPGSHPAALISGDAA